VRHDLARGSSGWRSRGYLPHFSEPGCIQLITIRLFDTVPASVFEQWKIELAWSKGARATDFRNVALRKRIEGYEDAGHGECWLRDPRVAAMVQSTLLQFDNERYRIIAWCIMPNHVHVVVEILEKYLLEEILHSWKSYSAHEANKLLGRCGSFWFREYHDRDIRNTNHLEDAIAYVENNPVKAGLTRTKEEWQWSSARGKRIWPTLD
jgi:REP element-mobilizing transposase RayT